MASLLLNFTIGAFKVSGILSFNCVDWNYVFMSLELLVTWFLVTWMYVLLVKIEGNSIDKNLLKRILLKIKASITNLNSNVEV